MAGAPEKHDRVAAVESPWTRIVQGLHRAWADEKKRRRMVVAAIVIGAAVLITVVISLFASLAGESQSFRDGYSAGGTAYSAYAEAGITSDQACRDEAAEPRVRPVHDDPAQWVQGCADAFNLAASDN
jgi:hypothetical protein